VPSLFITALSFALAASSASAATLTVNSTADDLTAGDGQCTLREAIINANTDSDTTSGDCAAGSGEDTILLAAGNYVRQSAGILQITSDVNLLGAGADTTIIDAAQIDQAVLFVGGSANARIEGVKITGACCPGFLNLASGIGVDNASTLVLVNSSVSDNSGTGVFSLGGSLTLINTLVSGNFSRGSWPAGDGAGVAVATEATLINSTVSGNATGNCGPEGCFGGGISIGTFGNLLLLHSTVTNNNADSGGDGIGGFGAVTLINSVLDNCLSGSLSLTSGGHNIDSDGSCGLTHPTDLPNADPMLGPLQDNGGPTWTHALQLGSPAIDAIPVADCAATWTDQRGLWRPQQGDGTGAALCDIGAYEVAGCADGLDNDGDGWIDFDGV
jgi:CSLREA domain-containing protein